MIITQTPLRISLLGGNTDFREYFEKFGGLVLTTTIDKYVYCIITKRFDDKIYLNYSIKECVVSVDDIKHDLVREAMKLVGLSKGVEITFLSDVPSEGSGLGSSSAVTVGVLNALHHYKGESTTGEQLAEEAIKVELDILKKGIGVQDQYAVALGGLRQIVLPTGGGRIKIDYELNENLMLFWTGLPRKSNVLDKMKLDTEILDKNVELALEGIDALETGDTPRFGNLMDEYWQLKKKLNPEVTNDLINNVYRTAVEHGAYGGKIVGAGGGGFLLLVVPPEKKQTLRMVISLKELPFRIEYDGSKVIFNIKR